VYPRYESLREEYHDKLTRFSEFVEQIGHGDIGVSQAEISYVNELFIANETRPDVLAGRVPSFDGPDSNVRPNEPSSVATTQHFTYRTADGVGYARLHILTEPIVIDSEERIRLTLVYRGEPVENHKGDTPEARVMRFFDEGHDLIVRAFAANTTAAAQEAWGRIQ